MHVSNIEERSCACAAVQHLTPLKAKVEGWLTLLRMYHNIEVPYWGWKSVG
jgi:hypothetical protein